MKKHFLLSAILVCLGYMSMAQIAHWSLSSDLNDVVGSKNGTNYGVTFQTDSERGGVAYFDGNSYASLPSFLQGLSETTIAVWFRMDKSNGWSMIYSFGYGYLSEPKHVVAINPVMGDGTERFKALVADGAAGGNWYDLPIENDVAKIETGKWYYSVLVIKADTIAYYINDEQVYCEGDKPWDLEGIADTSNYLGVSYWSDPLWNGALSDLRVYNYAMTKAQVQELHKATLPSEQTVVNESLINNPVIYSLNGKLVIKNNEKTGDEIVSVYNLSGRLITKKSLIDSGDISLMSGAYIVNISSNSSNYSTKVLVK